MQLKYKDISLNVRNVSIVPGDRNTITTQVEMQVTMLVTGEIVMQVTGEVEATKRQDQPDGDRD